MANFDIAFNTIFATLTSLILSLIIGLLFLNKSKIFNAKARDYTPENHKTKNNTPTMGGLIILAAAIISMLIWTNLAKPEIWLFIANLIFFGFIGFIDDWYKIKYKRGICERTKLFAQISAALIISLSWYFFINNTCQLPIFLCKNYVLTIGLFIIPWAMLVLISTSNAVNLTDGLDGLATSSLIINFMVFGIICYITGESNLAKYFNIPFTNTQELTICAGSIIGSLMGFLYYNSYPAKIFMGDVGSLALGSSLGLIALITRQEILLIFSGAIFIMETLSVIMQVFSYKYFKKRIFKMAPLHHHFELSGWHETKITKYFCLFSAILSSLSLLLLKYL